MNQQMFVEACIHKCVAQLIASQCSDSSVDTTMFDSQALVLITDDHLAVLAQVLYYLIHKNTEQVETLFPSLSIDSFKTSEEKKRLVYLTKLLAYTCLKTNVREQVLDCTNKFLQSNSKVEDLKLVACVLFEIGNRQCDFDLMHDSFIVASLSKVTCPMLLEERTMTNIGHEIQTFTPSCDVPFDQSNSLFVEHVHKLCTEQRIIEIEHKELFYLLCNSLQNFHYIIWKGIEKHLIVTEKAFQQELAFSLSDYFHVVTQFLLVLLNPLVPNTRCILNFKETFYLLFIQVVNLHLETIRKVIKGRLVDKEIQCEELLKTIDDFELELKKCQSDLNVYLLAMKNVDKYSSEMGAYLAFVIHRRGKPINKNKSIYDDSDDEEFESDDDSSDGGKR